MTTAETIDLQNATRDQLLEHARNELGLKPRGNISRDELVQLIAQQSGEAAPPASEAPVELDAMAKKAGVELQRAPKVWVRIHPQKGLPPRIFCSINGYDITIKPGAWVKVPRPFLEVLEHAVQKEYEQMTGEDGKIKTIEKSSVQFPYEFRELNNPPAGMTA